jgi:hypothetical protein
MKQLLLLPPVPIGDDAPDDGAPLPNEAKLEYDRVLVPIGADDIEDGAPLLRSRNASRRRVAD